MGRATPWLDPFEFEVWLIAHRELNTSRRVRLVFDWLAADWRRAEPVLNRIWQLNAWLEQDTAGRIEQIADFLAGKCPAPDIGIV